MFRFYYRFHAWGEQSHSSRVLLSGTAHLISRELRDLRAGFCPPLQQTKCEKRKEKKYIDERKNKRERKKNIMKNEQTNNRERDILFVLYKCTRHWASQQLTFDDNSCRNTVYYYCCSCLAC